MLPGLSSNDFKDVFISQSKPTAKFALVRAFARIKKTPDLAHYVICKFCLRLLFAFQVKLAAFGFFVVHVVLVRADKQMGRVDAGRIIAGMHDQKAVRNRSVSQHPGEPVRIDVLAAGMAESAIAYIVSATGPDMTITCSINKLLKSFGLSKRPFIIFRLGHSGGIISWA